MPVNEGDDAPQEHTHESSPDQPEASPPDAPKIEPEEAAISNSDLSFMKRIWRTYDHSFIGLLGLTYVNGGFKVLYTIVLQEMFKSKYMLGPDKLQVALAFITLPWNLKIFYGIVSDTIPVPFFKGASKKGYLFVFSVVQTICLLLAAIVDFESSEVLLYIFFICSLCGAFMDVVIYGVACIQQRKDLKYGAQDLNTWSWVFQGVGAIVGSAISGPIVQNWVPRYTFFFYALVTLAGSFCAFFLSKKLEEPGKNEGE